MKTSSNTSYKAFSLIEISIVILIIGILTAAISQGNKLIEKIALKSAQSITISSSINSIKDLEVWHETTLDESFIKSEIEESNLISKWFNINSQKINIQKINATQSNEGFKPKYQKKSFGMFTGFKF